ncbi:MAG: SDR family oxidoreductase [Acidobacteria bacterium]|nr:SDR family oxidoreductase [Acidobacteriota bacterium]
MSLMAVYPSLKGRAVVVTGGASGIGAAIVAAFARQGSRVAFVDIDDEAADALVKRVGSLKRMIVPEEVARLVMFLAADDSSGITSQSYVVDGGWV